MATTLPLPSVTDMDPWFVSNVAEFVQDYVSDAAATDGLKPLDGTARAGDGVFTMYPVSYTGEFISTFLNDWYYRIHFLPTALDLGNLLSTQTRPVEVWNAYFVSKTVESFTLTGGDDITVTQPQATPYPMAPLGLYTYELAVSTQGPPTINAEMLWTIDGVQYEVPITGRRVVVWGFRPDWSRSVDESLEWMTSIEASFSRVEHRVQQREAPRRVIEYTAQIVGADTGMFESVMFGWADRLFALPLWQEKSVLQADAFAGDRVLALPTADRSYVADGLLILMRSPDEYESVEIEMVAAESITLKKPLESAWRAGASVYPAIVARLDGQGNARYVAEDKLEMPVRFVGSPAETPVRLPDEVATATFNGVEVYTEGTNWINAVEMSYQPDLNVTDAQFGVFQPRPRSGWPTIVKGHEWLCKTKAEGTELRAFFARRRGRLRPVWMPTGLADFKLIRDVTQTDTSLRVIDNGYGRLVDGHPARKHILIQLRGGENIIREIDSMSGLAGGEADLNLMSSVGINFKVAQLRRISFLGLYRLAGDAVTFSHKTTEAAVVQASLQLTRPSNP